MLAILIGLAAGWQAVFAGRLVPRLTIGGVQVGRLTHEEALTLLIDRVKQLEDQGLHYSFKDHQVTLGATEGASSNLENTISLYTFDPEGALEQAWAIGHQDSWVERWFSQVRSLIAATEVPLEVDVNTEVLDKQLRKEFSSFTTASKNARYVWRQGGLDVTQDEPGFGFIWSDILQNTVDQLRQGQTVNQVMELVRLEPEVDKQTLGSMVKQVSGLVAEGPVYVVMGDQRWFIGTTTLAGFFTVKSQGQIDLDTSAMSDYLGRLNQVVAVPVIEARFSLKDKKVTEFAPSQAGKEVDVPATLQSWHSFLFKSGNKLVVRLALFLF